MEPLWSPVVATGGGNWAANARRRRKQAKSVATACHQLPETFHGKQGVCRGLPPVARGPLPEKEEVDLLKTPSPANPKAHRTRPRDSDRRVRGRQAERVQHDERPIVMHNLLRRLTSPWVERTSDPGRVDPRPGSVQGLRSGT